jgi:protein arginine N-methyltransferase 5
MQYETAIALALQDKMKDIDTSVRPVTVMVVGAGRGPLVAATLNASHSTNCPVKVYAVEKVRRNMIDVWSSYVRAKWMNGAFICEHRTRTR